MQTDFKKRTILLVVLIFLLIGMTIGLSFLQQKKQVQKGAFGTGILSIDRRFEETVPVDTEGQVDVKFNTTEKITLFSVNITYDKDKIAVVPNSKVPGNKFQISTFSDNGNGNILVEGNYEGVFGSGSINPADLPGGGITPLFSFKIKGKVAGSTTLGFGTTVINGYNPDSLNDVIIGIGTRNPISLTFTSGGAPAAGTATLSFVPSGINMDQTTKTVGIYANSSSIIKYAKLKFSTAVVSIQSCTGKNGFNYPSGETPTRATNSYLLPLVNDNNTTPGILLAECILTYSGSPNGTSYVKLCEGSDNAMCNVNTAIGGSTATKLTVNETNLCANLGTSIAANSCGVAPTPTATAVATPIPASGGNVVLSASPSEVTVAGSAGTTTSVRLFINSGEQLMKSAKISLQSADFIDITSCSAGANWTFDATKTSTTESGNNFNITANAKEAATNKGTQVLLATCTLKVIRTNTSNSSAVNYLKACTGGYANEIACGVTKVDDTAYTLAKTGPEGNLTKINISATGGSLSPAPTPPGDQYTCTQSCTSLEVCTSSCKTAGYTCRQRFCNNWNGYQCCTLAPTPTAGAPTPTGTSATVTPGGPTPNGGWPVLNFQIKFQGVTTHRADQKVKVMVEKPGVDKTFTDVAVTPNDDGLYSGSVTLTDVAPGSGYKIFVKGPKHLARKFCTNNQSVRCTTDGVITLASGANSFNFSGLVIEAGDLPNNGVQDGVVNSLDYSLWKSRIGSSSAADLVVADVNFDETVNAIDWQLMRVTLETKYEDEN